MREQRKKIAQETLKILQQGFYISPSGNHIDISDIQRRSESASCFLTSEEGQRLINTLSVPYGSANVIYEVINTSTVKAIIDTSKTDESVAALNFASAKNPGGGFLNGAMAQEEALSYASGLYNTQLRQMAYYEANRACRSMMYTDCSIYSPDVVFFRDEANRLLEEPVKASILTLPAVNMGQVRVKGEDVSKAKQVMKNRMRLCLAILAHKRNKTILLGGWGCGVFCNDPNDVARWWKELLEDEKYGGCFRRVLFVVLDKPGGKNIRAFERVFGEGQCLF